MALNMKMNLNSDSGIESESEENSVLLVVDLGDSEMTSRDSSINQDSSIDSKLESCESLDTFELISSSEEKLLVSMSCCSEYERRQLPEFFESREKGKSEEKYVLIRNHFINHWKRVSPKRFSYHEMLKKIGHLHLGNVTSFSRVQKFLESHKVINNSEIKRNKTLNNNNKTNKRKTVSPKQEGNQTQLAKASRTRPNPFKLVPLETFDSETQAPFSVRLSMEALAIVDIHAHCVRTEVIGLLGGRWCSSRRELTIMTSEPCSSLDDHDLQCDMEPVSQALAKEALEEKSCHVVGWYHSHPTFIPLPSLRDLETQHNFQQLFSSEKRPFIALILSPYYSQSQSLISQFKLLWINDNNEFRIPFELSPKIVRTDKLVFHVTNKLDQLLEKIKGHASRVQMMDRVKRFRLNGQNDLSHVDKLCVSLDHFLLECGLSSRESDNLLSKCREILEFHSSK